MNKSQPATPNGNHSASGTAAIGQIKSLSMQNAGLRARNESLWALALRRFLRHRMAVFGTVLLGAIILFVVAGTFFFSETHANTPTFNRFAPPSSEMPFGTDSAGRDVLARAIYGGQISLLIGIASVTLTIILGTVVGLASGYFGGLVDAILMRIVEALLAFPALILLLMLSRFLAGSTDTTVVLGRELSASVIVIIIIIGLTGWMGLARIVRALVLSLKEREFIMAARMLGASDLRILFVHILPNCIAPIVVTATLGIGAAIVTEASLSFLGFGVQPPTATWGNLLRDAQAHMQTLPVFAIAPGMMIFLTVISINFVGDGLRDALDPHGRR